ncbi:MAG: PhzF family phenazine biosynthesis protein [Acidisphaera sp.]|nr:PhzF family phenazine biosynthesis protein [Acidisphaera sp.]
MERRYVIADVFTEAAFGGNPLAVFLDGAGLNARQMQAIAREMNLSETTFVTPGSAPGRFRVRIFTPAKELPFAGHPTVGTTVVLAEAGATEGREEIVLEEGVGPVQVTLGPGRATLHRDGAPERADCDITAEQAADALGIAADAVAGAPWCAGYGLPYVFVRLGTVADVSACALRTDRWLALGGPLRDPYVFAFTDMRPGMRPGMRVGEVSLRARMFSPANGIPEDPATGSAAAALAGSLDGTTVPGGVMRLTIAQGVEMGRPSRIETATRLEDGRVAAVSVGGGVVLVGEGRLLKLP